MRPMALEGGGVSNSSTIASESATWDVILNTPTTTTTPSGILPPPPTQINKLQLGNANIRKDKRRSSSRFNISSNRELFKLPHIKGRCADVYYTNQKRTDTRQKSYYNPPK